MKALSELLAREFALVFCGTETEGPRAARDVRDALRALGALGGLDVFEGRWVTAPGAVPGRRLHSPAIVGLAVVGVGPGALDFAGAAFEALDLDTAIAHCPVLGSRHLSGPRWAPWDTWVTLHAGPRADGDGLAPYHVRLPEETVYFHARPVPR